MNISYTNNYARKLHVKAIGFRERRTLARSAFVSIMFISPEVRRKNHERFIPLLLPAHLNGKTMQFQWSNFTT